MATQTENEKTTRHPMRRLVGQAIAAGAEYVGSRMDEKSTAQKTKKKSHKMRNVVGVATIAGAAIVAREILRHRKGSAKKNSL